MMALWIGSHLFREPLGMKVIKERAAVVIGQSSDNQATGKRGEARDITSKNPKKKKIAIFLNSL
jgi:hypothetical protein